MSEKADRIEDAVWSPLSEEEQEAILARLIEQGLISL